MGGWVGRTVIDVLTGGEEALGPQPGLVDVGDCVNAFHAGPAGVCGWVCGCVGRWVGGGEGQGGSNEVLDAIGGWVGGWVGGTYPKLGLAKPAFRGLGMRLISSQTEEPCFGRRYERRR